MAKPYYRWPKGFRERILERDNFECRVGLPGCTLRAEVIDHIIPVLNNGAWFDELNVRAACQSCNQLRRRHTPRATPRAVEHW